MGILFGIKVIIDCFYGLPFQDVLIGINFLMLFLCAMASAKWNHYKLPKSGVVLILALILMFGNSMLQNPSSEAIRNYLKFLTSALIFYIGSMWFSSAKNQTIKIFVKYILWGYHAAFLYNIFLIILGPGRIQWGSAQTFRGTFYYKTDFAMFLLQYIIFLRYYISSHSRGLKMIGFSLTTCSSILIIFTNARIALLCLLAICSLMWAERKEVTINSLISAKSLFLLPVIGITAIVVLIALPVLFPNRNMLGIRLNESLLSRANTQGRIVGWKNIISYLLHDASPIQQLFGIDLVSTSIVADPIPDAHSLYFYCLFSIGIVGMILLACILFHLLHKLKKYCDEETAYTTLDLLVIMLLFGISQDVIIFTQHMWLMFFFYGLICGRNSKTDIVQVKSELIQ